MRIKSYKSENRIIKVIKKKIRTTGLFLALGIISIIGFLLNTIQLFTGKDLVGTFAYPSVLLGIGLIFESRIKEALTPSSRRASNIVIMKIITFIVGVVVLAGGLATLPFLNYTLQGTLAGAIGLANIIAMFVIIYEVFIIE